LPTIIIGTQSAPYKFKEMVSVEGLNAMVDLVKTYEMVENLIAEDADHVEGLLRGDRVYQDIAVNTDEVF